MCFLVPPWWFPCFPVFPGFLVFPCVSLRSFSCALRAKVASIAQEYVKFSVLQWQIRVRHFHELYLALHTMSVLSITLCTVVLYRCISIFRPRIVAHECVKFEEVFPVCGTVRVTVSYGGRDVRININDIKIINIYDFSLISMMRTFIDVYLLTH